MATLRGSYRGRLAKLHFDIVSFPGSQVKLSNLSIPPGLNEILTDLSREVMRAQPENIPHFAANFLEAELNKGAKSSTSKDNVRT